MDELLDALSEAEIKRMCDMHPDAYPDLLRAAMRWAYEHKDEVQE